MEEQNEKEIVLVDDDYTIDDIEELVRQARASGHEERSSLETVGDETLPADSAWPVGTETGLASSQGSVDDDETIDIDLALLDRLRQPLPQPDTDVTIVADRSLIANRHSDVGEVTPLASEPSRMHRMRLWVVLGSTLVAGCAIAAILYIAETNVPTTTVELVSADPVAEVSVPTTTVELVSADPVAEVSAPTTTVELVSADPVAEVSAPTTTVELVSADPVAEVSAPTTVFDDHGDSVYDATYAPMNSVMEGEIGYVGDIDFWEFWAVPNASYQIDVTPVTLEDPLLRVYDVDGNELGAYNYMEGSLVPRLVLESDLGGRYYAAVGRFDEASTGTYELAVSYLGLADAMVAPVGVVVEGEIDYVGDIDSWVFYGLPNARYQIVVEPVTLNDPFVGVYRHDPFSYEYTDDVEGSLVPRLVWVTAWSETLSVVVGSVDNASTGTYTLTVTYLESSSP